MEGHTRDRGFRKDPKNKQKIATKFALLPGSQDSGNRKGGIYTSGLHTSLEYILKGSLQSLCLPLRECVT